MCESIIIILPTVFYLIMSLCLVRSFRVGKTDVSVCVGRTERGLSLLDDKGNCTKPC